MTSWHGRISFPNAGPSCDTGWQSPNPHYGLPLNPCDSVSTNHSKTTGGQCLLWKWPHRMRSFHPWFFFLTASSWTTRSGRTQLLMGIKQGTPWTRCQSIRSNTHTLMCRPLITGETPHRRKEHLLTPHRRQPELNQKPSCGGQFYFGFHHTAPVDLLWLNKAGAELESQPFRKLSLSQHLLGVSFIHYQATFTTDMITHIYT